MNGLLEHLVQTKLEFVFKGGTASLITRKDKLSEYEKTDFCCKEFEKTFMEGIEKIK
ncbi:MAG: hypothetical protein Q8K02_18640 [Flavobacterium sp.]|nr:hypothetical protein [Flavobacterium sp.]